MAVFENALWIWKGDPNQVDTYVEFRDSFTKPEGSVICRLSCDGDYTLFVNGKYVASNQYGDFEYYKIYDEIDLSDYLLAGKNTVDILVWHFGTPTQRYRPAKAGLIYEIACGDKLLSVSGENTAARQSAAYAQSRCKWLTPQLGYSYLYDANAAETPFGAAEPVNKNCRFFPRPIEKQQLLARCDGRAVVSEENRHFILDLGCETVGVFSFSLYSESSQLITVSYGEHLRDGHVSRHLGSRDFSFEYRAKPGENEYTNYMLRLGCRYLEIDCESPITLHYAGVMPQVFPAKVLPGLPADSLDAEIYRICVRTLQLCMMEHYVDCPWREQCLYAFDSRNQMLCGYDAFENGNARYARANLKLLSKDTRSTDLLSICAPCGTDFTIPSFSLHFISAMREYLTHTKDAEFVRETAPKMTDILRFFLANRKDNLICPAEGKENWHFYDWSPSSDGNRRYNAEHLPDLCVNALTVLALDDFEEMCRIVGLPFPFKGEADRIRKAAAHTFFDPEKQCFSMLAGSGEYTELCNSLALLAGMAEPAARTSIAHKLASGELVPCSLSMKIFKYNAMLATDENLYRDVVLADIRKDYGMMLREGATSVWETLVGADDFDYAGSLCHGWSATPIHFYHRFGMVMS